MISHALTIIVNELNHHLTETYGISANHAPAGLSSLSREQFLPAPGIESASRECLNLTLVNIQADAAFKNTLPSRETTGARVDTTPLYLNLLLLLTATHASYSQALLMLGRAMQFFHSRPVFTDRNVSGETLTLHAPENALDRLEEFRFNLTLHTMTLEETEQIWAALKSQQVPAALYQLSVVAIPAKVQKTNPLPVLERRMTTGKIDKG